MNEKVSTEKAITQEAARAMYEALEACRSQFEDYALLHYRKRTAEGDEKALTNARMATLCDAALKLADGGNG